MHLTDSCTQTENKNINQPNLVAQILRKQRNVQGSLPDAVSFGGPLGKRSFGVGVDSFDGAYHYIIIRKLE